MAMEPVTFQHLPTYMLLTDYCYDLVEQRLKLHLWLVPGLDLRTVWEILADSFCNENLRWTPEVEMTVESGHVIKGSIFVGMKVGFEQMHAVLSRITEIDKMLAKKRIR